MNLIPYTASCVLLLILAAWFLRIHKRQLRDFKSEIGPDGRKSRLTEWVRCASQTERMTSPTRPRRLLGSSGGRGSRDGAKESQPYSHPSSWEHRICGVFQDDDLRYIADKTAALRMEMPWVTVELFAGSLVNVSKLHAFRAARLYCQIAGCVSDAAIASGSSDLMEIAARL